MNTESVIAIIRIVVPAACSVLAILGHQEDADSTLNLALVIAGAVCSIYSGWKNNNVTLAAQEAQKVLDAAKRGEAD